MRQIIAVAEYRPAYRQGLWEVPGADEDPFTMAVAAAERLADRPGTRRGHLDAIEVLGPLGPEANGGLPEALGEGSIAVRRHGHGLAGLGSALTTAARRPEGGRSVVVVADGPGPGHGGGAVAFELGEGEGLEVLGHGGRRHPTHRTPDATAWVRDVHRHAGVSESGSPGLLYFVAEASPPVLMAVWRRSHPQMPVVDGPWSPPGAGRAPSLSAAWWVADLASRLPAGGDGIIAHLEGEETHVLGLRSRGPVAGATAWPSAPSPGLGVPGPSIPASAVGAVSEGAYVARARYVENLASRWRFVADLCPQCSTTTFPQRGQCRSCGRDEGLQPTPLPRSGRVVASTVVAPGAQPTEFDPLVDARGGYGVVLAEIAPGIRVTLQVTDSPPTPLPIGAAVTTQLRRLYATEGEWRYGRKAIPVEGHPNPS